MSTKVITGILALVTLLSLLGKDGSPPGEAQMENAIPAFTQPENLEPRTLIFYPPGKAPSAELEFEPIPFTDLLPKSHPDAEIFDANKSLDDGL